MPVEYSEVREDGDCINDYVITKTWTASDDFGNTASQSQVVTVSDNTPPVITIPANVTVECDNLAKGVDMLYPQGSNLRLLDYE